MREACKGGMISTVQNLCNDAFIIVEKGVHTFCFTFLKSSTRNRLQRCITYSLCQAEKCQSRTSTDTVCCGLAGQMRANQQQQPGHKALSSRLCAGSPVVLLFRDLIVQKTQALKPRECGQGIQVLHISIIRSEWTSSVTSSSHYDA